MTFFYQKHALLKTSVGILVSKVYVGILVSSEAEVMVILKVLRFLLGKCGFLGCFFLGFQDFSFI